MKKLNKTKKCESLTDSNKEQFKQDWKLLSGMMKGKCKPKGQEEFDNFKKNDAGLGFNEVFRSAKKVALKDGYDQYILWDPQDGYSFQRKFG